MGAKNPYNKERGDSGDDGEMGGSDLAGIAHAVVNNKVPSSGQFLNDGILYGVPQK